MSPSFLNVFDTSRFAWAFVGPEATLYDEASHQVGRHSRGPTWELDDGSKVTAKVIAQAPSRPAGSIPQLLLQVTSAGTRGALANASYVQRLRTIGGTAPDAGCEAADVGAKRAILYSAVYVFYVAK